MFTLLRRTGIRTMFSLSTPGIALLAFGFTYLLAAAIFCAAAVLSRRAAGRDLQPVAPGILSPLGALLAVLIAFLAARVWTNFDRGEEYVGHEAAALRETVLLADSLPLEVRTRVRQAVKSYLDFIISEEWPAMAGKRASLQSIPPHLAEAMTAILSFAPVQVNQQLAQSRALIAIENALENRRSRVWLSQAEIEPIQWAVIVALAIVVLMTIAAIHIKMRVAMAIALLIFSSGIAISLVLLMAYDQPFGGGGVVISPMAFREVMPD